MPRTDLPQGSVTFMFTDIEGSTRLVQQLGESVSEVFDTHAGIVRMAIETYGGIEVNTEGDSFFCVFRRASDAADAAVAIHRLLDAHPWPPPTTVRVRIGIHTGIGSLGGRDYVGIDVNKASRVADAGNGGQVVLSRAAREAIGADLPYGVVFRDLGLHRLKDLAEPERLFDLDMGGLESDFPPLRTIGRADTAIPEVLSSFIGRSHQIAEVVELLDSNRLVTCTGPGGVGKTRLALEVASALQERFDGVFFVPLAPVADPVLVASAIVQVFGVPPSGASARDHLLGYLSDKRWLLVLDNFEHVLDAAPLVGDILSRAPATAVLITSRAALRVAGEREYFVPPLQTGDSSEAVRLFIDRAQEVRPGWEPSDEHLGDIIAIVEALEGIPLAIELAAARTRLMTASQIKERLGSMLDLLATSARDADERQRTLRSTIAWSYDLLTDSQKALLQDLAVFRGGATIDTIQATCGVGPGGSEWIEDLDALVGHSLVTRVETKAENRFILLEMVREFASEQLEASGRAPAVRSRHLDWFLALAERAAPGLLGVDQGTWLDTLDRERNNLDAALTNAMEATDGETATRLIYALWRYWHMRGPIHEGAERAAKVLTSEGLDPHLEMKMREAAGGLAWWGGDIEGAANQYLEWLDLARELGTKEELGNALYNAGLAIGVDGDTRGIDLLEEGIAVADEIGDTPLKARIQWGLAAELQLRGHHDHAHQLLVEALPVFTADGDLFREAWAHREIGAVKLVLGDVDGASEHLAKALEFFSATGDLSGSVMLLRDHAHLAAVEHKVELSYRLLGASIEMEGDSGLDLSKFDMDQVGLEPRFLLDEDAGRALLEEGAAWTLDHAVAQALERW